MTLEITLHGPLVHRLRTNALTLELPGDETSVAVVASALSARHPDLAAWLPTVAYAVGDRLLREDELVRDGDVLSLLPPVSGG